MLSSKESVNVLYKKREYLRYLLCLLDLYQIYSDKPPAVIIPIWENRLVVVPNSGVQPWNNTTKLEWKEEKENRGWGVN